MHLFEQRPHHVVRLDVLGVMTEMAEQHHVLLYAAVLIAPPLRARNDVMDFLAHLFAQEAAVTLSLDDDGALVGITHG